MKWGKWERSGAAALRAAARFFFGAAGAVSTYPGTGHAASLQVAGVLAALMLVCVAWMLFSVAMAVQRDQREAYGKAQERNQYGEVEEK